MTTCSKCNRTLTADKFYKSDVHWCKDCRTAYYAERREYTRLQRVGRLYKISPEQYLELAKNGCHICGSFDNLHVDHDHSCCDGGYSCGECVRGVLCHNHNRAIGLFRDDPDALNTAAEYLNQWAMSR
jgi:hypothetical protein